MEHFVEHKPVRKIVPGHGELIEQIKKSGLQKI